MRDRDGSRRAGDRFQGVLIWTVRGLLFSFGYFVVSRWLLNYFCRAIGYSSTVFRWNVLNYVSKQ
jgi:hypothetical protein